MYSLTSHCKAYKFLFSGKYLKGLSSVYENNPPTQSHSSAESDKVFADFNPALFRLLLEILPFITIPVLFEL
jgi:hypothetical protein